MTYLHRHCIVDEAVTVDRPPRVHVFAANNIAHNIWCLWLVLCGQKFCSSTPETVWELKLLIDCAYLLALVHAMFRELPQKPLRVFKSRYALHDIDEPRDLNGADTNPEKFCNLFYRAVQSPGFKLAVALPKSKLTHDVKCNEVAPVVDDHRLAVVLR